MEILMTPRLKYVVEERQCCYWEKQVLLGLFNFLFELVTQVTTNNILF